jgi:hypothetical protein
MDQVQFFRDHAGLCIRQGETQAQASYRMGRKLAAAEAWAARHDYTFEWDIDRCTDSSDFDDSPEPWALWVCVMRDSKGIVCQSLCGIDFGRDKEPWGDSYKRVVEAELALEQMP